ncbi:hypothetical protein K493DRAFT_380858 [Basidiobolus meristosporus CBS 931.73]|uniref:FAR1 domain-containing protein n=1 Tax=Basidiobolus meristosporus CBS 931.73 TaxID=1314790 RepID=A0A1Y1XX69_9FUNG|nr:hypothetical protein K493DRAFT_380858 [Basidiobolus meristosporus CBS 931.73]|eukprot:ORX90349.1 hypothetical protein K493DRAFT_380858 [Basidiobolus meristosporus CBS 931.73]
MDFREIFAMQFNTAQQAFEWCQQLAKKCGFGVRRRTSKSSTIYIVCSREGRPESKKNAVLLYLTDKRLWEFRAGKCMVHNHCLSHETNTKRRANSLDEYHLKERPYGCSSISMSPPLVRSSTAPQTSLPSPVCRLAKPKLVPLINLTQKYQTSVFHSFPSAVNSDHFDCTFTQPFGILRTPTSSSFPLKTAEVCSFDDTSTKLPPITTPPLEHTNPGFESIDSDTSEEEPSSRAANQNASRSLALEFILNKQ